MKVVVVIVAALMLASAHAADVSCAKLCSGGAASCQTADEATGCQKTYQLSAMNACVQCGTLTTGVAGTKDAAGNAIGGAAGDGKWWKSWNSGTCNTCVANCETCASDTTCAANGCKSGYRLKDTKTCEACTKANCVACTGAAGTCTACKTGYGLKAGECVACTANCNQCNTAPPKCDNAASCMTNYALKTGDSTCYSCVTKKSVTDSCTKAETWQTITGNDALFQDNTAGTCNVCVTNCAACATKDTCTTCKGGFRKATAAAKVCEACGVANCNDCDADKAKCAVGKCKAGFKAKTDQTVCVADCAANAFWTAAEGSCTVCDANAASCASKTTVNTCNAGFRKTAANKCEACDVANCSDCQADKTQCAGNNVATNKCKNGFFPDQTAGAATLNKSCKACSANCKICANQYSCQTCMDTYQRGTDGKCTLCKGDVCDAGLEKNGATAASKYHNNRWDATRTTQCTACITGCGTKVSNAVTGKCDCNACTGGYWPMKADGTAEATVGAKPVTCTACGSNCNTCASSTKCKANSCKAGYTNEGADGACVACTVTGCQACNAAKGTCTDCGALQKKTDGTACVAACAANQFWTAAEGSCTVCDANAASCTSKTAVNTCKAGFRKTAANKCEACDVGNCSDCQADKTTCTGCKAGFDKKADSKVCYACEPTKSAVWSDTTKGTCTACNANCAKCASQTTCDTCSVGYVKDAAGACQACSITNCASCDLATRATTCKTCTGKYAIQSIAVVGANGQTNKCDAMCDTHATSCTDAYTAAACDTKKNYYLASGRCVYCNLQMKTTVETAAAGKTTTAGNQYLTAAGVCATCDSDADGCDGSDSAFKCKTATNERVGGNCVKKCGVYEINDGYDGKCNSGCVSNVASTGTVNGGARGNSFGGCYGMEGREAQLCSKGYHVQGASVGKCCDDDNAASGLVAGSAVFASVLTAFYALM